jgi:methionine sulfoxide reductase heme-binding subunit
MRASFTRCLQHKASKPVLFALCVLPLAWLVYAIFANLLGANPAEKLIRETGGWTLKFLCATLAITPLRQGLKLPALIRFRRMLGVFTFTYGCLHLLSYSGFDKEWELMEIWVDIVKRPFILVGSCALLLMTPLALTSFNRAIKALGAARWRWLHKMVYAVVVLGLLHFFWMRAGKNNFAEVAVYAAVIGILLGWRIVWAVRKTP